MLLYYAIAVISVKFLYQLPFFCGSPPYSFAFAASTTCDLETYSTDQLLSRIDFLIGVRKYSGPSSYPPDQGLLAGLFWDFCILLTVLLQRYLMTLSGAWNCIALSRSSYHYPQYIGRKGQQQKQEQQDQQELAEEEEEEEKKQEETPQQHTQTRQTVQETPYEASLHSDSESLPGDNDMIENVEGRVGQLLNNQRKLLLQTHFSILQFFYRLHPPLTPRIDNMAPPLKAGENFQVSQFICQLLIFIYILFCYDYMARKKLQSEQEQEMTFSAQQIYILCLIISVMIADRIFYRLPRQQPGSAENDKNKTEAVAESWTQHVVLIKLALYITLVVLVHYYLLFHLPGITQTWFVQSPYLIICYVMACAYLYFSALQIRYGYPLRSEQLFSQHSTAGALVFRAYTKTPFLFEIKNILDWTVTPTALTLYQWFKLEDLYCGLLTVHLEMTERREEHKFGEKRPASEKFQYGCCALIILLFVILFPILAFSALNPTSTLSNVTGGLFVLELSVSNATSFMNFRIFASSFLEVELVTPEQFERLQSSFYGVEQEWRERLTLVRVDYFSDSQFLLTQHHLTLIRGILASAQGQVQLKATWQLKRPLPVEKNTVDGSSVIQTDEIFKRQLLKALDLASKTAQPTMFVQQSEEQAQSEPPPSSDGETRQQSTNNTTTTTANATTANYTTDTATTATKTTQDSKQSSGKKSITQAMRRKQVQFPTIQLLPMVLNAGYGTKTYPRHFEPTDARYPLKQTLKCSLELRQAGEGSVENFWTMRREPTDFFDAIVDYSPDDLRLSFFTLNEKAMAKFLSYLAMYVSVIGLYTTVVLTVGGLIRQLIDRISQRVIYEEMPNPAPLFDLCESVYVARTKYDIASEERYYELLIRIYRSPELLRRLTGNSLQDGAA